MPGTLLAAGLDIEPTTRSVSSLPGNVCLTGSDGLLIGYKVARQFESHPLRQGVWLLRQSPERIVTGGEHCDTRYCDGIVSWLTQMIPALLSPSTRARGAAGAPQKAGALFRRPVNASSALARERTGRGARLAVALLEDPAADSSG
jgi:hypothetical protein